MLTLPARLAEVARHVLPGLPMADVGTDHAQLPAWLVASGHVPSAIAIDNKPGPLEHARKTLLDAGVGSVELRRGDGLGPLSSGEVATVVLAGLGGARIVRLLEAWAALPSLERLVLQPNTDWPAVRELVGRRGFELCDETMVLERGHAYLTLVVDPSITVANPWCADEDALVLGPRLRVDKPPAWHAWIASERARLETALHEARSAGATNLDDLLAQLARFTAASSSDGGQATSSS